MTDTPYELINVRLNNIFKMREVAKILNLCGKDMATKYDLHHWDNSMIKSIAIALFCSLKNKVFLLCKDGVAVATFMIRIDGNSLHFEKLGTLPKESGKGIGTICLDMIENIAKEKGLSKVKLEVYEPSKNAIEFYAHRGFVVVGKTETLKFHELIMEKIIE